MKNKNRFVTACLAGFLLAAPVSGVAGQIHRGAKKIEKRGQTNITQGELYWEALATHRKVIVSVTGKDFRWRKQFNKGEEPEFNALAKSLKPGIYHYQVTFFPNELEAEKKELRALTDERDVLIRQYEEAVEAGDAKTVKRLYWQANEVRNQAVQLNRQQMKKKVSDYDFVKRRGEFLVDEFGLISKFDRAKAEKTQREKILEELRRKRGIGEDKGGGFIGGSH